MNASRILTPLTALLLCLACIETPLSAQVEIDLENGPVFSGYNDVRIPNDAGTLFSLSRDLDLRASYYTRIKMRYMFREKHTLALLIAPLNLDASGRIDRDVFFLDRLFPAGTPVEARYTFNSFRLTYSYAFYRKGNWRLGIGITAKIRDAEIRLTDAAGAASKANTGFVPLLNFLAEYRLSPGWSVLFSGDALASPGGQGRAEDILLAVIYRMSPSVDIKVGYRILEGGADVDEVYNFALLHYLVFGATLRL